MGKGKNKKKRGKLKQSSVKREKVFLCIPSTGYEHVRLSHYIENELRFSGHEVITTRQVARPTDYSRNCTVEQFVSVPEAQECDWYYTIDSDTVPPQGTLGRLLGHKKSLVCGVTFSVTHGTLWMPVMAENPSGSWTPDRKIYEQETYPLAKIDGIGAACMLVHRSVIEKVLERYGVCFKDYYHESGKRILGQDLDFSRKVRGVGEEVWCDMEVVCDHYKEVNLKGMANHMLEQQNVLRLMARGAKKHFGTFEKAALALFDGKIDMTGLEGLACEDDQPGEANGQDDPGNNESGREEVPIRSKTVEAAELVASDPGSIVDRFKAAIGK